MRAVQLIVICAFILTPTATGRIRFHGHRASGSVSTRHRLTVNTLITEPGTFEWEWYGSSTPAVPTVWKVTPSAGGGFWGRTELSAGFDLVTDADGSVHATDHVSLAATTALPSFGSLQLAFAPAVTVLNRVDLGVRAGGLLLGKLETGRHTTGFSAAWSGATHASATNPAGLFDFGGGYGFRLAAGITAHTNVVHERAAGYGSTSTIAGGMEWQARANLALDITIQSDRQLIGGLTWNLRRIHHR